jgi:pilus assembly protein Flp/PilA
MKVRLFSQAKDITCGVILMRRLISNFLKNESGATAIEYALIAGGLSIVILAAVQGIGVTLNGTFATVQTALK